MLYALPATLAGRVEVGGDGPNPSKVQIVLVSMLFAAPTIFACGTATLHAAFTAPSHKPTPKTSLNGMKYHQHKMEGVPHDPRLAPHSMPDHPPKLLPRPTRPYTGVVKPIQNPPHTLGFGVMQAHAPFRVTKICKSNCHRKQHYFTTSERICYCTNLPKNYGPTAPSVPCRHPYILPGANLAIFLKNEIFRQNYLRPKSSLPLYG